MHQNYLQELRDLLVDYKIEIRALVGDFSPEELKNIARTNSATSNRFTQIDGNLRH